MKTVEELREKHGLNLPILLLANKADVEHKRLEFFYVSSLCVRIYVINDKNMSMLYFNMKGLFLKLRSLQKQWNFCIQTAMKISFIQVLFSRIISSKNQQSSFMSIGLKTEVGSIDFYREYLLFRLVLIIGNFEDRGFENQTERHLNVRTINI